MKPGDLVKVEGGALRPPWYGEIGIVKNIEEGWAYIGDGMTWYLVALIPSGQRVIRDDMLVLLNEAR